MHRVELKASKLMGLTFKVRVPNAPCGVERLSAILIKPISSKFLMHRVELKVEEKDSCGDD